MTGNNRKTTETGVTITSTGGERERETRGADKRGSGPGGVGEQQLVFVTERETGGEEKAARSHSPCHNKRGARAARARVDQPRRRRHRKWPEKKQEAVLGSARVSTCLSSGLHVNSETFSGTQTTSIRFSLSKELLAPLLEAICSCWGGRGMCNRQRSVSAGQ